ncbi:MAG: hypothetical protein U0795_15845 [Pirellulales bacterium]
MGRFLKKVYFIWYEPRAVKRMRQRTDPAYRDEQRKFRRIQFLAWLHVVGMFGLVVWIKGQNAPRRPEIWAVLAGGAAAGFIVAYFVPWVSTLASNAISVTEDGISHRSGQTGRRWKYDQIKLCTLSRQQIDDQTYEILAVTDNKDQTRLLGLDSSVPTDELVAKLREMGMEVREWSGVSGRE